MSEFIKDLEINKFDLDKAILEQPQLFWKYAKKYTDACDKTQTKKRKLSIAKALAEKEIREKPESFEITKVTEGAIKAAITLHEKVKKAEKALQKAMHEEKVLGEAKEAFKQRKSSLENLTYLYNQMYFSEPKAK